MIQKCISLFIVLALVFLAGCYHEKKPDDIILNLNEMDEVDEVMEAVESEENVVEASDNEIDTSEWLTYRNEEYGLEFQYPVKWGFVKKIPNLNQIRILEYKSKKFSASMSITQCDKNCAELDESIAFLQNDNFNGCMIHLHDIFRLDDKEIGTSVVGTSSGADTINLSEEKCLELFNSIDEDRVQFGDGGYRVDLLESDIPEEGKKAYDTFQAFVDSFTSIGKFKDTNTLIKEETNENLNTINHGAITGYINYIKPIYTGLITCAESVNLEEKYCTDQYEIITTTGGTNKRKYSINVPDGSYYVYTIDEKGKKGYYSEAVTCGLKAGCPDDLIAVNVKNGEMKTEINPLDWLRD